MSKQPTCGHSEPSDYSRHLERVFQEGFEKDQRAQAETRASLAAALTMLDEARPFMRHRTLCDIYKRGGHSPCTCGHDATLARIDALKGKP